MPSTDDYLIETLIVLENRSSGFFNSKVLYALYRNELAKHLHPEDRPDQFIPTIFEIDAEPDPTPAGSKRRPSGKLRVGAAVTLEDRVVFVWQERIIRPRNGSVVLKYDSITAVKAVIFRAKLEDIKGIEVLADRRWPVLFTNNYSDMSFWRMMLHNRLTGAVQPIWRESDGTRSSASGNEGES